MDADLGPEADPAMAILDNRLPYMDRETLCKEHGYNSCIKWLPCRSKDRQDAEGKNFNGIKPDPNDVYGSFGEASIPFELQVGEGLPGRCFAEKDKVHHAANLQDDPNDPRAAQAKALGVAGAFAVFRDGAVWEFVQDTPMKAAPAELVESFGGSTGLDVASTAVLAAVRFKRKGGFGKKKDLTADSTLPTHDEDGRPTKSPKGQRAGGGGSE